MATIDLTLSDDDAPPVAPVVVHDLTLDSDSDVEQAPANAGEAPQPAPAPADDDDAPMAPEPPVDAPAADDDAPMAPEPPVDAPAAGSRDFFPAGWTPSKEAFESIQCFRQLNRTVRLASLHPPPMYNPWARPLPSAAGPRPVNALSASRRLRSLLTG